MTKKDPYYTYTDYWPCKPRRKFDWTLLVVITLVIALAVVGALALPALPLQGG